MSHMEHVKNLKIPLNIINECTQNFNSNNLIGRGGYGKVYKGLLSWADHKNQLVAVKRLDDNGFQGNKEFYTEITMLSQYRHDNIINLIGFCDDANEMIIVYEYATHGSLDTYLTDHQKLDHLSWKTRLNICVGIASALDYLHNQVALEHRLIHRDMKSSNILLDENWNPKLSDFGLSRIGLANQQNTFVITNVAGTHGYCDPQYERTGILTKESDVYSFGVVLFEVLCGRLACVIKYHDERRFLHHLVRSYYQKGELHKIADSTIMDHIKSTTMTKFSAIAYQCIQETRQQRPTIAEVLKELREIQFADTAIESSLNRSESSSMATAASPVIESTSSSNFEPFATGNSKNSPYTTTLEDPNSHSPYLTSVLQEPASSLSEAADDDDPLPAVESLQIEGEAFPGKELSACGYSVNGTTSCNFEWLRHTEDGSVTYIEGAKKPNYVVTADDVDAYLAVEVQPLDNRMRKGEIVKTFANEHRKIGCDSDMLDHIRKAHQAGYAEHKLSLWTGYIDMWDPVTLVIKKDGINIKGSGTSVSEKFSPNTTVFIPSGNPKEFSIIGLGSLGRSFRVEQESAAISSWDVIVLTLRYFIKQATEKKKKKKNCLFFW